MVDDEIGDKHELYEVLRMPSRCIKTDASSGGLSVSSGGVCVSACLIRVCVCVSHQGVCLCVFFKRVCVCVCDEGMHVCL